ncbi:MAG TPA: YihY/virulence factor BrkB family protein [Acidobacteriota bacterium]|nr:YihY/virulence factor BrkB family protein [Acidobacteriota bacterium]
MPDKELSAVEAVDQPQHSRFGRIKVQRVLHVCSQSLDRTFPIDLNYPIRGRVRIVTDTLLYLFGRDGTILISSIAFSFFFSVFPIIVLLLTAASYLGLPELRDSIFQALSNFFPIAQDFIIKNLDIYTREAGQMQVVSLLLIAWSGSTLFFALEAGLDSAYRIREYRNFVFSQALGTGLTIVSGVFVLLTILLLGTVEGYLRVTDSLAETTIGLAVSYGLALILFFTIYYYLPNRPRKLTRVLVETNFSVICWLIINGVFQRYASSWSLQEIYGPFYVSMTLLLWAYASGCVLLGTARLSADGFFGSQSPRL